ncbi:MAG: AMP-binding protein, partial [Arenicellales bacterium]|nr:AMP-binding protein [Arenicellales bacterium]
MSCSNKAQNYASLQQERAMLERLIDPKARSFEELQQSFRWQVPEYFNMAHAVCDRHTALADKTALFCANASGQRSQYTFGQFQALSNRLANALKEAGVAAGERVAIVLPQRVETALSHLAVWKLGAISLPLSVLFGQDALRYRLEDSGARVAICAADALERIQALAPDLPQLTTVIDCDDTAAGFWPLLERGSDSLQRVNSRGDDPALIIYTSGTTGPPKGAVIAHRCLLGNLTGFEMS